MSDNAITSPSTQELLRTYFRLGLTSFGGPVAHIGYYRREFIEQTGWMSDEDFAERLALCQALPGPTSSQMAFASAWKMSGSIGMGFACLGLFLVPSMVVLLALGLFFVAAAGGMLGTGFLRDYMNNLSDWMVPLVIAVISYATIGMAKSLIQGPIKRLTAGLAFLLVLFFSIPQVQFPSVLAQLMPIILGAIIGVILLRDGKAAKLAVPAESDSRSSPLVFIGIAGFFVLMAMSLVILFMGDGVASEIRFLAGLYEAGALSLVGVTLFCRC